MNHKSLLLMTCAVVASAFMSSTGSAYADLDKKAKPAAGRTQTQPVAAAKLPTPAGERYRIIVEVDPKAPGDDVKDALNDAHGRIIKEVGDDQQKVYLIEVDRSNYADAYKKLTKDKKFKTVQLNRTYSLH